MGDLEVAAGHDEVVGVVTARDLSAIAAVAKSLRGRVPHRSDNFFKRDRTFVKITYSHCRLSRVFHLDVSTEAASRRHVGQMFKLGIDLSKFSHDVNSRKGEVSLMSVLRPKILFRAGIATGLNTSRNDLQSAELVELAICLEAQHHRGAPFDRD